MYYEAILVWKEKGPSSTVSKWLTDRGLQVVPMRQGLLISGEGQTFEAAFRVALGSQPLPAVLPIPPELQDNVSSITVPKPPDYQQ